MLERSYGGNSNLEKFPSTWVISTLQRLKQEGSIYEIQDGNHGELYPRKTDFSDNGKLFLTANSITDAGLIDISKTPRLPEEFCKKLRIGFAKAGDVLFTHNATVGRVAVLSNSIGDCIVGTSVTYYRLNTQNIHEKYFAYALQSPLFKHQLNQIMFQTTRMQVPITAQQKLFVALPPYNEQKKIASILSKVDELNQKTDQIIEQTQRLKKGLMQKLLTKGTEVQLLDIIELAMGQSPPGNSYGTNHTDTPLLNGPTEFGLEHPIPVQFTTKPTKLSQKDDILLCVRGSTTGRLNRADRIYCIGRGLASIRGKDTKSNTRWLYYQFQRIQNRIYDIASGGGSTFPNINSDVIRKIIVPCPNLDEQLHISNILSNIDKYTKSQIMYRAKLQSLKKGLMQNLLTGKIRIKV